MCGFAGIFNSHIAVHRHELETIASSVCFRGPDSCGVSVYDEELNSVEKGLNAMFFNRLAIIDLDKRSNQPFEDERFSLVFNGEIYNYKSLKSQLLALGLEFQTSSDTEVLFHALKYWGIEAIGKLNGMFAFCFLDRVSKKFILARDRIGIKPLYYRQEGHSFSFASELNSLLRLSHHIPSVDEAALQMYLWMQFIPTPFTPYQGVYKLPPGHYIEATITEFQKGIQLQPKKYWDAYDAVNNRGEAKELETVLVDSLQRQLVADVPLGLFLSSGVDSSLLAALVNKHFANDQSFNFFTVAFSESTSSDESQEALEFIRAFRNDRLVSHVLQVDPSYIGNHLDTLYDFIDEPFGDYTVLLNWVISKKAKEHVTVVLSGDGADELFWGYPRYDQWRKRELLMPAKMKISGTATYLASSILPYRHHRHLAKFASEPDPVKRHFMLFLHPAFERLRRQPVFEQSIWAMQGVNLVRSRPDLSAILDVKTYLADAMLFKVDRASSAASIEARVPYLDNEVIDQALTLKLQNKIHPFANKAPLKSLLLKLAPHYDVNRPKKGFNFPLDQWLRFAWRDRVLDLLSENGLNEIGLDGKVYMNIVNKYYKGNKRLAIPVWYLYNLMLWKKSYKGIAPLKG